MTAEQRERMLRMWPEGSEVSHKEWGDVYKKEENGERGMWVRAIDGRKTFIEYGWLTCESIRIAEMLQGEHYI